MLFVCAVVHLRYALISCFFRICQPFNLYCRGQYNPRRWRKGKDAASEAAKIVGV